MKYEVTVKLTVRSPNDADRVAKQIESVFEFGTVGEAIAEGLALDETPHLVDVSVGKPTRKHARAVGVVPRNGVVEIGTGM